MRPENLKAKIFLDSADPQQTSQVVDLLGFLDGQTTNPSLVAKSFLSQKLRVSADDAFDLYRQKIEAINKIIPSASISVEVYADSQTTDDQMLKQARQVYSWAPNIYVKLPITEQGLMAAQRAVREGMRVNMTLCFTQEQAAAVYSATAKAGPGQVYISPFVGRLDDAGFNGVDLVENIMKMLEDGDGHVAVLAASIRHLGHLQKVLDVGVDIMTAPLAVYQDWHQQGLRLFDLDTDQKQELKKINYQHFDLSKDWKSFKINNSLTSKGLEKFVNDWNEIIENN